MQASWGTGVHRHTYRGWRRPWRGAAFGPPGPTRPEEALSGQASDLGSTQSAEALAGATQVRNSCSRKRPCVGGSGPGLVQLEEALVGGRNSGPGTVPPGEALAGAGVQARGPSRLMGARGAGGSAGRVTLQSPDSVKVPLLPC